MSVKGRLADIRPRDILNIYVTERKTAALHLTSPIGFGHIYINDGVVVHALYRDMEGQEALKELLNWKEGEFEVEPDAISSERSIDEDAFTAILGEKGGGQAEGGESGVPLDFAGDSVSLIHKLLELDILERI